MTSYDVRKRTDGCTIYYEHETGTDQVLAGGATTAILGTITSGDFDITQRVSKRWANGRKACQTLRGDGEFIMKIRRFLPDFISQVPEPQLSTLLQEIFLIVLLKHRPLQRPHQRLK